MESKKDIGVYFKEIEKFFDEENFEEALNYLDRVLKTDPDNLKALSMKSKAFFELDNYEQSMVWIDKALKVEPNSIEALNQKGLIYLEIGKKYRAIDYFNDVLKIEPKNLIALKNKVNALIDLDKEDEALELVNIALKIDDKDPYLIFSKAFALYYLGRFEESIKCYDKVLEISNENKDAVYYLKTLSLEALGETEDALNEINKALKVDQNDLDSLLLKAQILRELKRFEKSLNCLEKIIELDSDHYDAYFEKGNVFKDLGNTEKSIDAYEKFIRTVRKNKIPDMDTKIQRTEEYLNWVRKKGTTITFTPGKNPRFWQWTTRPEFFLEEDGTERKLLEPGTSPDPDDWWTCHKNTLAGDLILLYRAGSKKGVDYKDIKYLIMASSDAYPLEIEEAVEKSWKYGCHFTPLFKFKNSLKLDQMRKDPYLEGWNALNAIFKMQAYSTKEKYWKRLNDLLSELNPDYQEFLSKFDSKKIIAKIKTEREFETELIKNIHVLQKFDLDLDVTGRQVYIGSGGFIDILGKDKTTGDYMVIELKIEKANRNTFGQISEYIGWVMKHKAKKEPVKGIVISRGMDQKFKAALNTNPTIKQIELSNVLSELGMKLK